MSEWAITYRGIVYPAQCDHMGHMNVMWYTGKFDEASWQLLSMLGLTQSRFSREGTGMVAVDQHLIYKKELRAGDAITIHSALLEVKQRSLRFMHEMKDDSGGELAATSIIVGVHIDANSRRATPLPRMCLSGRDRRIAWIFTNWYSRFESKMAWGGGRKMKVE